MINRRIESFLCADTFLFPAIGATAWRKAVPFDERLGRIPSDFSSPPLLSRKIKNGGIRAVASYSAFATISDRS